MDPTVSLPILSLFSGAGGLDFGFKQSGFDTCLAIDSSLAATKTYERNHPNVKVERADLSALTAAQLIRMWNESSERPPLGVIGGPPCQSFSVGNSHPKSDDPRQELSFTYAKLLKELNREFNLRFFLFENVGGLLAARNQEFLSRLKSEFENSGFDLSIGHLDASQFGVAQRRKRFFIVGLNRLLTVENSFSFPDPKNGTGVEKVSDVIRGLPEPTYFRRGLDPGTFELHPNHWAMVPKSEKFTRGELVAGSKRGRSFRVLDWNSPSPTVAYGNREVHVHPNGHRRLSVYEAMRLQGFPHDYVLLGNMSEQFRQVSDAVPPPVANAIARSILDHLSSLAAVTTGGS